MAISEQEVKIRLQNQLAKVQALKLMVNATILHNTKVMGTIDEAIGNNDVEKVIEIRDELDRGERHLKYQMGLLDQAVDETRRILVGAYGPAGGIMFDAIKKSIEEREN